MKKLKNGIRGSGSSGGNQMASVKAMALMTGDSNVRGSLHFRQASTGGPTHIQGRISGLSPGLHGFHIHALGDTSNGCNSTGVAEVSLQDWLIPLSGPNSILGRAVVVHADPDDLGKGGHELSKTTGNAGARVGCGIIGLKSSV
ncbi:superoxide dismutase [Cu-Zn] 2-like isoform X5 [Malus sylvestris]|uniref:superoxide dismutase [Cu-Zn] 2-like isoform X5 n=1 Tax=Malus sylvestris TaxID=3752 RepID=UPI0021ABC0E7|nr:superoxide dismutase [Cu-Zn] 2-like isoform X5 [Malus sylvestris]